MTLLEYSLLATGSIFAIVDPVTVIPTFIAMTPGATPAERNRMARLACLVAAGVLLTFSLCGQWVFRLLGITMPAFQMAGSIVLLLVALDMLQAQKSGVRETSEEMDAGAEKEDVAITPLAVPLLAGPGAMTTCLLLHNQAKEFTQTLALCFSIVLVMSLAYIIFRLSAQSAKWLSPIALKIASRIMGLLLAAVAMQFLINALKDLKIIQQ